MSLLIQLMTRYRVDKYDDEVDYLNCVPYDVTITPEAHAANVISIRYEPHRRNFVLFECAVE